MSRHEGVSCDSCMKGNFRGRRYKCLICYDYDLCEACYEAGATNTRHGTDHPMQCILTRADFDLFYAGEAITNVDQPQAYTCPYCSRMGFTDATLQEHVVADHVDTSYEVVCPVCAASPGGDPNLMTDDFAGHLTLEHRTGTRDLISFLDEPVGGTRHNVRRMPHSGHLSSGGGRGGGGTTARPRRSNMHFSVFSSAGLTSLSPSSRDPVDPIAELLSQLSGVRRSTSNTTNSSSSTTTPSQLQQLQMQLQLERAQVSAARQQLERLPSRRQNQSQTTLRESSSSCSNANPGYSILLNPSSNQSNQPTASAPPVPPSPVSSNFLLEALLDELTLQTTAAEQGFNDRYQFAENLLVGTMTFLKNQVNSSDGDDEDVNNSSGAFTNQAQVLRVYPASCEHEEDEEQEPEQEDDEDVLEQTTINETNNTSSAQTEIPPRASVSNNTRVLRGRARSDGHNALRRADANKSQPPPSQKSNEGGGGGSISKAGAVLR